MDAIASLANAVGAAARQRKARITTGQYYGGDVRVGNGGHRPINAGDTYPVNGKPVYCIVDGESCYVVSDK